MGTSDPGAFEVGHGLRRAVSGGERKIVQGLRRETGEQFHPGDRVEQSANDRYRDGQPDQLPTEVLAESLGHLASRRWIGVGQLVRLALGTIRTLRASIAAMT